MKHTIHRGVQSADVPTRLPAAFRERSGLLQLPPNGVYDLIPFTGGHDEVTRSPAVRKALADISPFAALVVAAIGFTAEARAALVEHNAQILVLGEFPWTDESYAAIRQ